MNLLPLISLNFFVVGLRIASDGEMYVWLCPAGCFCNSDTSNRGMAFSPRPLVTILPGDWDFVGDVVLGERSVRGFAVEVEEDLVGDISTLCGSGEDGLSGG